MAAMTAEQAVEAAKGLTFEKVWAMFEEVGRKQAELNQKHAETEQIVAETSAAVNRLSANMEISRVENGKVIKELSKNIAGVNRSLGKWAEQMISAKLWKKFRALGYDFTKGAPNIYFLENGQRVAEADVFLENGEYVMPVETKTDLIIEDVDEHIDRIKKIRAYMDNHNDKRIIIGAVAGAIVPDNVCRYAQKKGLYVITQSGDSVVVAEAPQGFIPQKWYKQ